MRVNEKSSFCDVGIKKCPKVNFILESPNLYRRKDDSEENRPPPGRGGNNQYGASGIPKCYHCRLKKFRVCHV
jgi:hypothetical protein